MESANCLAGRDVASLIHPFTNLAQHAVDGPLVIDRGEGVYVYDADGNRYLEGMAGLWCTALGFGDIPASSIIVSPKGTLYVVTDFGVVQKQKNAPVWHPTAAGLPNVTVSDLVYVAERGVLYAATHGQGVWQLKTQ